MDRKSWAMLSRERKVEAAYAAGAENRGDFHDGYMNFGLWEPETRDYREAAENLVRRIGTMLGLDGRSRVLDVACGLGAQDVFLLRSFNASRIDAVDVTWKHVEQARGRAREARREDSLFFHHGSAVRLPFPDASFTHALCIDGAAHFDTRESFFREAFRVLRPRGVLALSDFCLKREPRAGVERCVFDAGCGLWQVPRANLYTAQGYRERLQRCGFGKVSLEEAGNKAIPGYCREMSRPECRGELTRFRGAVGGRLAMLFYRFVHRAYARGLVEYVLVRAEKPSGPSAAP